MLRASIFNIIYIYIYIYIINFNQMQKKCGLFKNQKRFTLLKKDINEFIKCAFQKYKKESESSKVQNSINKNKTSI